MGNSRNRDFTEAEIHILSRNRNIKKISSKQITYQDWFKELFIAEHNAGKLPRDIFIENGFDLEMIGQNRIDRCSVSGVQRQIVPKALGIYGKETLVELKFPKAK